MRIFVQFLMPNMAATMIWTQTILIPTPCECLFESEKRCNFPSPISNGKEVTGVEIFEVCVGICVHLIHTKKLLVCLEAFYLLYHGEQIKYKTCC